MAISLDDASSATQNGLGFGLWVFIFVFVSTLGFTAAEAQNVVAYPVDVTDPNSIVEGPDGNFWFTADGSIGKIDRDGNVELFALGSTDDRPDDITVGPNDDLWFVFTNSSRVGRIQTDGVIQTFSLPVNGGLARGITLASDGNIWFTTDGAQAVGRITPEGSTTVFEIPGPEASPTSITEGPDGNLWVPLSNSSTGQSRVFSISTSGEFTRFDLPDSGVQLFDIVAGPDGNLWLTASNESKIRRITVSGAFSDFDIPTSTADRPRITVGPDDNLWFTQGSNGSIGRIDAEGSYREFDIAGAPEGITASSDAAIWFTDPSSDQIGRLSVPEPGLLQGSVFSSAQPASQSFLRLFNTGEASGSVSVSLTDFETGETLGNWNSPDIEPNSQLQFQISTLEQDIGVSDPPDSYSVSVNASIDGYFQHVLWRSADGTLTNLSTCASGITADRTELSAVHTSILADNYPSTIVIYNTGLSEQSVDLTVRDARDGNLLGTYTSPTIPSNGQAVVPVTDIEADLSLTPDSGMFHYVIQADDTFAGYLQHLVNNQSAGVITDMSNVCSLTDGANSPAADPITEFDVPGEAETVDSSPFAIVEGPSGDLWFTAQGEAPVGRISSSGAVTRFASSTPNLNPTAITLGPDGNIWFAASTNNVIGRVDSNGVVTEFEVTTDDTSTTFSFGIAAGPDGNLWLTQFNNNRITVVTPSGSVVANYDLPNPDSSPFGIVSGDDELWFTQFDGNRVGRITVNGGITEFDLPEGSANPRGITLDNNGNAWVALSSSAKIAKVEPSGTITEYSTDDFSPNFVATGPNGNVWATYLGQANYISVITENGFLTNYRTPTDSPEIQGIAATSGGDIWFAENGVNKIGTLTPSIPGLLQGSVFSSAQPSSQSFLRLFNTGDASGSVTVSLTDFETGEAVGNWISPDIAPDSQQQFQISAVEQEIGISDPPDFYSVSAFSKVDGYFQHVLWRSADGTLTNLSTCGSGVTADPAELSAVHTSILADNYPSTIVIYNTTLSEQSAALAVRDARDGELLGTYTSPVIPAKGQFVVPVTDIEADLSITPDSGMFHYVIQADSAFGGYLQHLVNNQAAGVITDMSNVCRIEASDPNASL